MFFLYQVVLSIILLISPIVLILRIFKNKEDKYRFYKKMRHIGTLFLPDVEGLLYNGAYTDALGRHTVAGALYTDYGSNHNFYFQYQNSTGFPIGGFWGFDFYHNANFQLQLYD